MREPPSEVRGEGPSSMSAPPPPVQHLELLTYESGVQKCSFSRPEGPHRLVSITLYGHSGFAHG